MVQITPFRDTCWAPFATYLSIIPTFLFIYLSIRISTFLYIYLSIYISIHLSIYPSIYLSIYLLHKVLLRAQVLRVTSFLSQFWLKIVLGNFILFLYFICSIGAYPYGLHYRLKGLFKKTYVMKCRAYEQTLFVDKQVRWPHSISLPKM